MSGPLAFLYDQTPVATPPVTQQGGVDPLSFLYGQQKPTQPATPQDNQGFFSYVSNLASNWFKVQGIQEGMNTNDPTGASDLPVIQQNPELAHIASALRQGQANPSGLSLSLSDYGHMFGKMFDNVKDQLSQVINSPSSLSHTSLPSFFGQIGKAMVTPIGDMMELQSDVQLSGDDIHALTPEEKADRIKNVVATGAMIATGSVLAKGLAASDAGFATALAATDEAGNIAPELGTSTLQKASTLTAKGAFARDLMQKTAVAGASGAAYGLARYPNSNDQLAQTLINGVVFAPLGAAFEMLDLGAGAREKLGVAREAGRVAQLRQVQDVMGTSMQGVINKVESLSSADDIAEALFNGNIKTTNTDIFHIPGVSADQASKLVVNAPEGFTAIHRLDPSGDTGDLLVYSNKYKDVIDPQFFSENGFARDQVVSYNRGQYKVIGGDGKTLELENVLDQFDTQKVANGDVKPLMNMQFGTPLTVEPNGLPSLRFGPVNKEAVLDRMYKEWKEAQQSQGIESSNIPNHFKSAIRSNTGKVYLGETHEGAVEAAMKDGVSPDNLSTFELGWASPDKKEWMGSGYDNGNNPAKRNSPLDDLVDQRTALADQITNASEDMLPGLTRQAEVLDSRINRMQSGREDPIGFDEIPSNEDLLDMIPEDDVDYSATMKQFFQQKGFSDTEINPLTRDFEKRLHVDMHLNHLEPEDREFIERAISDTEASLKADSDGNLQKNAISSAQLVSRANRNGMLVVDDGSGNVHVKDIASNRSLFKSQSFDEVAQFINKSLQADGVDLDGGVPVKTSIGSGGHGLPPQSMTALHDNDGFAYRHAGKTEALMRYLDSFPLITRNREYFTNLDTKYGTQLFSRVFDTTQSARRISNAKIRPYYEKLQGIDNLVAKMNIRQREQIGEWMQTMTPDEVINKFMTRKMNPLEQTLARKVAASKVDIQNVFAYNRMKDRLETDFPNRADTPAELDQFNAGLDEAKQQYGIDDKHEAIADLFKNITALGKKEASLGGIVRLARSIQENELSRTEYAAKSKMSFEAIRAGNQLEAMYKELGDVFGIPQEQRLGGYMTHARLYDKGDLIKSLKLFGGDVKAREFYAKMARTGEVSAFEKDPIRAMQRYIKGGMDAEHFSDVVATAKNSLREEVKKLPGLAQEGVMAVANRYLSDLQGLPGAGEAATQASVNQLLDTFKIEKDIDVRRQIVNAITAVIPAATQGARVMAGTRDFATHMMLYSSRFGYSRMARAIVLGAKAMSGPIREELERLGDITVASPIAFTDATDAAAGSLRGTTGAISRGLDRTTKALFRLSGQKDVYAMMHSGAYLEVRERAAPELLKLSRGETKWASVVKKLKLNSYDQPVVEQFKNLVRDGKTDEAARFLAIQTGYEQIGVFGLANQPYMWGSNIGRIVGQYGNWPMWLRSNITRMASRGTVGERMAAIARLGAASAAIAGVGSAAGLDLSSWSIIKGMAFAGGPLLDVYETLDDAVNGYGYEQKTGLARLKKMLPYDPTTGQFNVKQLYIPGSYFMDDLLKAVGDFNRGQPLQGAAQVGGFHPVPQLGGL